MIGKEAFAKLGALASLLRNLQDLSGHDRCSGKGVERFNLRPPIRFTEKRFRDLGERVALFDDVLAVLGNLGHHIGDLVVFAVTLGFPIELPKAVFAFERKASRVAARTVSDYVSVSRDVAGGQFVFVHQPCAQLRDALHLRSRIRRRQSEISVLADLDSDRCARDGGIYLVLELRITPGMGSVELVQVRIEFPDAPVAFDGEVHTDFSPVARIGEVLSIAMSAITGRVVQNDSQNFRPAVFDVFSCKFGPVRLSRHKLLLSRFEFTAHR